MFTLRVDDEIALGLLEERHAQALFDLTDRNRDFIREWLLWIDHTKTAEDSKNYIKGALKRLADNNGLQTGIFYKGELVGMIGFLYFDWSTRRTEIGYWLSQDFNGRGIMTRAAYKLTRYAFEELDLNRVEIRCGSGNFKSRAIPERLGYIREATLREVGVIHDNKRKGQVVYAMLASDWKSINV